MLMKCLMIFVTLTLETSDFRHHHPRTLAGHLGNTFDHKETPVPILFGTTVARTTDAVGSWSA